MAKSCMEAKILYMHAWRSIWNCKMHAHRDGSQLTLSCSLAHDTLINTKTLKLAR